MTEFEEKMLAVMNQVVFQLEEIDASLVMLDETLFSTSEKSTEKIRSVSGVLSTMCDRIQDLSDN